MCALKAGDFLIPLQNSNSLWFIFHHGPEGTLAVDLTTPHPNLEYTTFQNAIKSLDAKPEPDKIILKGGEENVDSALLILHESDLETDESHRINQDYSFLSHSFALNIIKNNPAAASFISSGKIDFPKPSYFLIIAGYRSWPAELLDKELHQGFWTTSPADTDIVFHTPHTTRYEKALSLL